MRDADRAEPKIGVAQHHPLGGTGRTRGVEQGGECVGIMGRGAKAFGAGVPVLKRDRFGCAVDRLEPRAVGDQQRRTAIGEDVRCLRAAERGIDRDMDQPGARGGERQDAGKRRLAHPARNAVTGGEAVGEQGGGGSADDPVELGVGQRLAARDQRHCHRLATQRKMVERVWRRVRIHSHALAAFPCEGRGLVRRHAPLCGGLGPCLRRGAGLPPMRRWHSCAPMDILPTRKETASVDRDLRALLVDVLGLSKARVDAFDATTELFGALPEFDSLAVANLLTGIEERLSVVVEDDDVEAEDFMTYGRLLAFATRMVRG